MGIFNFRLACLWLLGLWSLFLWRFQKHTDRSDRVHWTILLLRFLSAFSRRQSWFFILSSLGKEKNGAFCGIYSVHWMFLQRKNYGRIMKIKGDFCLGLTLSDEPNRIFPIRRFRFQNSRFFLFRLLRTSDFPPAFSAWMKVACVRMYEKESNILHWIPENNGKSFFLFFPPESGPEPGENFNTPNLLSEVRFFERERSDFSILKLPLSSRKSTFHFRKAVFCFLLWKTGFLLCTCSAVWSLLSLADFFFFCFYSIVAAAGGSEGTKLPERDSLFIFLLF